MNVAKLQELTGTVELHSRPFGPFGPVNVNNTFLGILTGQSYGLVDTRQLQEPYMWMPSTLR